MRQLAKKEEELYLSIICDLLRMEIHMLEEAAGDPDMYRLQIEILEKESPKAFANKIKQLKNRYASSLKKWQKAQNKICKLKD